jgi:hypothetical protein
MVVKEMNAEDWGSFFGYFDVSSHPPIIDAPFNGKINMSVHMNAIRSC